MGQPPGVLDLQDWSWLSGLPDARALRTQLRGRRHACAVGGASEWLCMLTSFLLPVAWALSGLCVSVWLRCLC